MTDSDDNDSDDASDGPESSLSDSDAELSIELKLPDATESLSDDSEVESLECELLSLSLWDDESLSLVENDCELSD